MTTGKLLFFFLFFTSLINVRLEAQEISLTSGNSLSGTGGTVSYSVGQVVFTTTYGVSGSVAQGVQQAYEISNVYEVDGISLICSVYPNPTTDLLVLKIDNYNANNLSFQLIDAFGKVCQNAEISGPETIVSMNYLPAAIYFIKVIENNRVVKIFKVVKY